jgi:hypothetical protein
MPSIVGFTGVVDDGVDVEVDDVEVEVDVDVDVDAGGVAWLPLGLPVPEGAIPTDDPGWL